MSDAADKAATEASDRVLAKRGGDYRQDELRKKIANVQNREWETEPGMPDPRELEDETS